MNNYRDEMKQFAEEHGVRLIEYEIKDFTEEDEARIEKLIMKQKKRERFFNSVLSGLRTIIYTPLSIAFHAVSFVSKIIGFISSFGLIAGVYYLYQSFSALRSGVPLGEIVELSKAVSFIIFPFIAYFVSYICEKIYEYLERNAI